jgi:glyoxylate/hydroxypyruvate reductase
MEGHTDNAPRQARSSGEVVVVIATPLEAELVETIRAVDQRITVLYQPDLLPPIRYVCDHKGLENFRRTPEQEGRWRNLLSRAEVLFGLPGDTGEGLAQAVRIAPRLRYVQGTAAGTGEQVRSARLTADELARVAVTSASGVHAVPLAEFVILGLLSFTKDLPRLLVDKAERRWERYPMPELRGQTILIVGFGSIGEEVGRLAGAFGMHVVGVNRSGRSASPYADEVYDPGQLRDLLPAADALVLTLPLTDQTRMMIDSDAFQRMRPGAVLVNVGRGGVVDEAALVSALREGRLRGAVLDVFATEPLPGSSPLWDMPNVLITSHTAALSRLENARIVELFSENLRRYLASVELINRLHPELLY